MNWLHIHKKHDPNIKTMINMNSILAIHFEYHENNLDKIIIFTPGEMYKIDTTFDHKKILLQLGF